MILNSGCADIFVPDGTEMEAALARTTHLGIGAHADDLEILAWPGIAHCHSVADQWFSGVVATDGAGSPRSGRYAAYSDTDMIAQRQCEQCSAASLGEYACVAQLGYSSRALQDGHVSELTADLLNLLSASRPRVVYLHNLADSHRTHVVTALASIAALRQLPVAHQPAEVYGVEIWRSLDWLPQTYRVDLETDPDNALQGELLREFDSQISGGKRYDLAVAGRQAANATFSQAHRIDRFRASVLAMDLSPLLRDTELSPAAFLKNAVTDFSKDVLGALHSDDVQ